MNALPIDKVAEEIIQQLFNRGQYQERLLRGELRTVVIKSRPPKNLPPGEPQPFWGEPPGTLSQVLAYKERNGNTVAIVHRYWRPNGTIGASGKPDPKRLYLADRIVELDPRQRRPKRTHP